MSEKTEPATDKKLNEARKKGQVPQSADLAASFAFAFALTTLVFMASTDDERIRKIILTGMAVAAPDSEQAVDVVLQLTYAMVVDALWICAPVLLAAMLGGVVGGLAHVGFNVSFEPLTPKFDKLDPVAGVKRMFSLKTLFEVFKSVVKAIFIGWVLYESIRSLMPMLVYSGYGQPVSIGIAAWDGLIHLFALCAALFVVLGVIDFVIQRLLFLKDQKMSKDEVKREYKQDEGDPQIKGERKAIAREIAFSDPAPAVAQANAVVVNPTHYAVALRYEPEECGLPFIVARGVDGEAAQIREAAKAQGVPIIGNPELARALYKIPLRSTVPEPLLESVAIVLRWAEQLRGGEPA
ncbi:type III secretion system export apparatus subunit SctU [Rubrivivax sp. RP6-9]|uniref:type III secretion system export apparatus subunit SctU n=1 Tax=Rubrivivax sp. RP6-9 TaxID=3415750 RepID=UPI003CC66F64